MKIFEGENYYQILQVPANAGVVEIKRAYRDALAIYEEESTATYSLFSAEERERLLHAIKTAFDTLIDDSKRTAYNQTLLDSGLVDADAFTRQGPNEATANADEPQGMAKEKSLSQWVQKKAQAPEIRTLIDEIMSAELISGGQLKALREAYGIELSEIYTITKISAVNLNMIEADRYKDLPAEIYLKQFLKSYAEILQVDPMHVVKCYFNAMAQE